MKKRILCTILSAAMLTLTLTGCFSLSGRRFIEVYETTGTKSKLITRQTDLEYKNAKDASLINTTVEINPRDKYQAYYGNGAAITHSSAYLLNNLPEDLQTEVLTDLFSSSGANFRMIRVPIGASDYIETDEFFTCNDIASGTTDYNLEQFNLDHDENIIAVLQKIKAINKDAMFIAVPWTAPSWMKSNNSYRVGTLKEECIDVYAAYLTRFLSEYKAHGIHFQYVSLVNEPYVTGIDYPGMLIDGHMAAKVINKMTPKLKSNKLNTKVLAYDHNYSTINFSVIPEGYLNALYSDKKAAKQVAGVAYHGYGEGEFEHFAPGLEFVTKNFKKAEIFLTEITEHYTKKADGSTEGSIDFASNISYAMKSVLINPANYGTSAALYWNFALTDEGTPVKDNSARCFGVISLDPIDGDIENAKEWSVKKNASYYAMSHFSRFVYPVKGREAVRISTKSSNTGKIIASSFLRADNRVVVITHNTDDSTREMVDFVISGRCVTLTIQPQSVVTIVL